MVDESKVELNLDNLLWRTRGQRWDYTFVLHPLAPFVDSWYEVHSKVFVGVTPSVVPASRGGTLFDGDDEHCFIATAFQDPVHRDSAGRPIAHYMIYFLATDQLIGSTFTLPTDWGLQVLLAVRAIYDKNFEALPSQTPEASGEEIEDSFASARGTADPIKLDGNSSSVLIESRIIVEKKKSTSISTTSTRWLRLFPATALLLFILALLWLLSH